MKGLIPNAGWVVDRLVDKSADSFSTLNVQILRSWNLLWPHSLSYHKHKGHQRSLVGLSNKEKCGDKRPSSMEVFAIAVLTHQEMTKVDRENKHRSDESRSDECYFTFPNLVFLMDKFGGCRMFQSYFDGKFHVQFSELLDLVGHMIAVPAYGEKYFDIVDRKDFLKRLSGEVEPASQMGMAYSTMKYRCEYSKNLWQLICWDCFPSLILLDILVCLFQG
ncbi:uncharacterized protein N7479_000241 [Penicillium vulpinum]|uniref:uncharacterized protein n=1 Tax=Penicillium vulpinum TaxID=29845 RepID=UPI0025466E62|nr:uncharacterized protein N7479_000241 [Penicillium vulpinum]KAJ5970323.1 hypothetical protein N7479_000241 [Penicillium vulpinum]